MAGDAPADDETYTRARVFAKFFINSDSMDSASEFFVAEFSPDNGSTWFEIFVDQSNEDSGTDAGWKMGIADLSPTQLSLYSLQLYQFPRFQI